MLPFNFNHLYYFYVVATQGSFSHAADELGVSQSSISVQIKQLEETLGHRLFNRIKTGVELTEPGQVAFQYAEDIFSEADGLKDALQAVEHSVRGLITIGTVNSIGIYMLPNLLKIFNSEYPDVKINIIFKQQAELVEATRRGRVDFAIFTTNRAYTGLSNVPLQKNKMFLVAPSGHALTRGSDVALSEIEKYPFLGFEEGMQSRMMMDAHFKRLNLSVEYVMESSNVATLKHMVMAGLGLAILPEQVVAPEIRDGQLVRPSIPSLYMTQEITAYYRRNRVLTPAKKEFLRVMKGELQPGPRAKR